MAAPQIPSLWVRGVGMFAAAALNYLVQRQQEAGHDTWFTVTNKQVKEEIGMSRHSWITARRKLKGMNIIQERDIPIDRANKQPRRIEYLVDVSAAMAVGPE